MNQHTDTSMFIYNFAKSLGPEVLNVAMVLLGDNLFQICSGSSKPGQHHYGNRGLIRHTAEVINLTDIVRIQYQDSYDVDKTELFFAALFHDSGKMFDYECSQFEGWHSVDHKRMIHHISRSGIIWNDAVKTNQELYDKYFEKVLHAILSHHMSREAGSPVAPKSRVAWMVTLCDNLSARMYDADTLDILNHGHGKGK